MYLTGNSTIPPSHHPTIPPCILAHLTSCDAPERLFQVTERLLTTSWVSNLIAQKGRLDPWKGPSCALFLFLCWMWVMQVYLEKPDFGRKKSPLLTLLQSTICLGRVGLSPPNFEILVIGAKLLPHPYRKKISNQDCEDTAGTYWPLLWANPQICEKKESSASVAIEITHQFGRESSKSIK